MTVVYYIQIYDEEHSVWEDVSACYALENAIAEMRFYTEVNGHGRDAVRTMEAYVLYV